MFTKIYKFTAVIALLLVIGFSGCRAAGGAQSGVFQQPEFLAGQQNIGKQLGQRAGNIAINQVISAGISRLIGGL